MSNQETMQQLTERFMNDADFREEMRQDPKEQPIVQDISWTKRTGKP